jgi:hypothetical protein
MKLEILKPALVVVLLGAAAATTGCSSLKDESYINVEFEESIQGLQRGDLVFLLGLPVGEVKTPYVLSGKVIVPVSLRDATVFGPSSKVYFYLAPDDGKLGRQSLNAVIHPLPAEPGKPRFRGFTSKLKLNIQIGSERVGSWWKNLGNLY